MSGLKHFTVFLLTQLIFVVNLVGMNIRTKIVAGFGIIILFMFAMGAYLLQSMLSLSRETEKIYKHPFAVSNAARDITIQLLETENYLKDMIISVDGRDVTGPVSAIADRVWEIHHDFELIGQRFLGDKTAVEKAFQAFISWETVFNRVLFLCETGKKQQAATLLTTSFSHRVKVVNEAVQTLSDFASGKASEFYTQTLNNRRHSILFLAAMLLVSTAGAVGILVYVVRNHDAALEEINRYFHLIDQNILITSTDEKGRMTDISNAMCRFLGSRKKDLVGKPCDFFINRDDQEALEKDITRTIHSGKNWEGDIRRIARTGETQWIHLSIHPDFDEHFNIRSFTHIVEDISDKKVLEELSITDNLTNLHNRRYFDEVIETQIRLARRSNACLTLAILDIDCFKLYNDNYGHPAGDAVLADLAAVLKQIMNRPNDYIFRLGGEEFGLLFSDSDKESTRVFLDRIRKEIQSLGIEHRHSLIADVVTVSLGARVCRGPDIPHKSQLYSQADQALYDAKQNRNRVVVI